MVAVFFTNRKQILHIIVLAMQQAKGIITLAHLLFLSSTKALQPEFFSDSDFSGDIPFVLPSNSGGWEENPQGCFNFPQIYRNKLSSVIVNDNCVIIYDTSRCTGDSFKLTIDVPNLSENMGNITHDNFNDRAISLRFCDESEGWISTNVELYTTRSFFRPDLQYNDLCECVTFPSDIAPIIGVENHHNCVKLYSTENCNDEEGIQQIVLPGRSSVSKDLSKLPIFRNAFSISPCSMPPACFELEASLFEIQVTSESKSTLMKKASGGMSLSAKTVFINNGTGTVTMEYMARKEIRQVVEVEKMTYSRRMTSWTIEKENSLGGSLKVTFPVFEVIPVHVGLTLSNAVKTAYTNISDSSEMRSNRHMTETSTEFAVRQMIRVPPCSGYSVDSFVTVIEGYPMIYKAFFRIKGSLSGQKLKAEELINELGTITEYTYNHTVDDFTVVAYATSSIKATFGMDTEIWGQGEKIRGCYP